MTLTNDVQATVFVTDPVTERRVLRMTAVLACEMGESAHRMGVVLKDLLEQHNCEIEVIDASVWDRLDSWIFEKPLRLDAAKLEAAEHYESSGKQTGCAKCRRPISPNRRHCFACAMGKR